MMDEIVPTSGNVLDAQNNAMKVETKRADSFI